MAGTNETGPKTYPMSDKIFEQVQKSHTYQSPKEDQPVRYQELRKSALKLSELILAFCPPSREQSLALTKVEESVMWANKAIAVNE